MITQQQLDLERQHYYELGIIEGKRRFKTTNFISGLSLGLAISALAVSVLRKLWM